MLGGRAAEVLVARLMRALKDGPAFVQLLFDSRGPTLHRTVLNLKSSLLPCAGRVNYKPILMRYLRKLFSKIVLVTK